MVTVALSELKSLHNSLSSHLAIQKFEKYFLILFASTIFTQIPFKIDDKSITVRECNYCSSESRLKETEKADSLWNLGHCVADPKTEKDDGVLETTLAVRPSTSSDVDRQIQADIPENGLTKSEDFSKTSEQSKTEYGIRKAEKFSRASVKKKGDITEYKKSFTVLAEEIFFSKCYPLRQVQVNKDKDTMTVKRGQEGKLTINVDLGRHLKSQNSGEFQNSPSNKSAQICPQRENCSCEISQKEEHENMECLGERAYYMATRLGIAVLILLALLAGHDLWIDMSNTEIDKLRIFAHDKQELKICDHCATELLRQRKKYCKGCKDISLPLLQSMKKRELLEYPPAMKYLERKFFWQNIISAVCFAVAIYISFSAVRHNHEGFECRISRGSSHSIICNDMNKDISKAVMDMVSILSGLYFVAASYKFFYGPSYGQILKAFQKPHI